MEILAEENAAEDSEFVSRVVVPQLLTVNLAPKAKDQGLCLLINKIYQLGAKFESVASACTLCC
jgi:hypothetical protein